MIADLKKKLKTEGRSTKWFIDNYVSDKGYQTVMQQINGFAKVQDYLVIAIKKYLGE